MRLTKGKTISAPVFISGVLSEDTEYQVKVEDLIHQGEHFYLYQGEDIHGTKVCLKSIRYRSEKKEKFSADNYIQNRRDELFHEHKLLSLTHPCLPEPLAMMALENTCSEDEKLFRKIPQWKERKKQEPVLVQEQFTGDTIDTLSDKLKKFSLKRRLDIISKLARFCQFLHSHGYILQNLHPSHVFIKPRNDDNVYVVGLHHGCGLKDTFVDREAPSFGKVPFCFSPLEIIEKNHNCDKRVDLFQLGMLLYYLITFHDPSRDNSWWKKSDRFEIEKERTRLENAIKDTSFLWVIDLIDDLTSYKPETRIPDIETLLSYLKKIPKNSVKLAFSKANLERTELKVEYPDNTKYLKVRLEIEGNPNILEKKCVANPLITLPSIGIGKLTCSVAAVLRNSSMSRWIFQQVTVAPNIKFTLLKQDLLHKFSFTWQKFEMLSHIEFRCIDSQGNKIDLGSSDTEDDGITLPPDHIPLPYYTPLDIECIPHFSCSYFDFQAPSLFYEVWLYPPIPSPKYEKTDQGIILYSEIPIEQADTYEEIELLDNGYPKTPKRTDIVMSDTFKKISFLYPQENLDVFEAHHFALRVLVKDLGWKISESVFLSAILPEVSHIELRNRDALNYYLHWESIDHPQLLCYEIKCHQQSLGTTQDNFYGFSLPLKYILDGYDSIDISICARYLNEDREEQESKASTIQISLADENIMAELVNVTVSPINISFSLDLSSYSDVLDYHGVLQKKQKKKWDTLEDFDFKKAFVYKDEDIISGKTYGYRLTIKEKEFLIFEKEISIPEVEIAFTAKEIGYEDVKWKIEVSPETEHCLERIEFIAKTNENEHSVPFNWHKGDTIYYFQDENLQPGQRYEYKAKLIFSHMKQTKIVDMGEITTKIFTISESFETFYNKVNINWAPSPAGKIEAIEIFDPRGKFIAKTKSDCISLENLEPQKKYSFPLKYRYLSGRVEDGKLLTFETTSYEAPSEGVDIKIDSFRLRWNIDDISIAAKIKDFILEVSENVGKHVLSKSTRSVQLKQLHPCTKYKWKLYANLKSHSCVLISSGETITKKPNFTSTIEIGLVHHIKWDFSPFPAVDKIEIHRDGVSILQTKDNEMYDSDFKNGTKVLYQFYYLLKDGNRVLAGTKEIKALSMGILFNALKITPGIGSIKWDFNQLKSLPFLKYIELYNEDKSLFKQGSHLPSLFFEDFGEKANGDHIGLPDNPINFRLAVVGVAPTEKKCKKKWTLNVKGVRCYYADVPACLAITSEYSCVYFEWEYLETPFLKEIILRRAGDGVIIYQGPNQGCIVYDDNQGKGLERGRKYAYTIEMIYSNYHTSRLLEVSMNEEFDPARLELKSRMIGDILEITWNPEVETSITHIGWKRTTRKWFIKKMFTKTSWSEFSKGIMTISVNSLDNFWYEIGYQDCYGHTFYTQPQNI